MRLIAKSERCSGCGACRLVCGLTNEKIEKQSLPAKMAENFIGGRGFVAKTLFDELPPDVDPLGPDNIFMV